MTDPISPTLPTVIAQTPSGGSPAVAGGGDFILRLLPTMVGIGALAAYAMLVGRFLGELKLPDAQWIRAMSLFTGVETIAFAAAGFIFGREVNRGRAERAELRAAGEAMRADGVTKEAEEASRKGRQIAREIVQLAAEERLPTEYALDAAPHASRLSALASRAESLFPLV